MEHTIINDNIDLYVVNTDKFKDLSLEVRFLAEVNEKNATTRSLLTLMMQDRSLKYDSKLKMNNALDDLYGAYLSIRCTGYGKGAMIRFGLRVIDNKFSDQDLLTQQFAFVNEIIFKPLLNEKVFKEAKESLTNELLRIEDEPRECASKLALSIAGKGQPLAIDINGDLEILKTITLDDIKAEYHNMIDNDQITIGIVGNITTEIAKRLCMTYLPFNKRSTISKSFYTFTSDQAKHHIVEKNIEQTVLMMIYNSDITINDHLYWPLKLATAMLGQLPISLLFMEIREKRSLCYNISSSLLSFDGVMIINTGMDYKNIEQTETLIKQQIASIQVNTYTDELLESAKQLLINSVRSVIDNANAIMNFAYLNHLANNDQSYEQTIKKIEMITKEEIQQAFNSLSLNTTFILKKKGDQDA